jgi:uncharacterized repeat protein (TIGR01451 family)
MQLRDSHRACNKRSIWKIRTWLLAATLLVAASAAQAQVQRTIINTSFEQPALNPTGGCLRFLADTVVPGWITTEPVRGGLNTTTCQGVPIPGASATGRPLELWAGGFQGVPARAGVTFVELNAFNPARLRQDVCLLNGETVDWSASHRGRSSNTVGDVMEFKIGAIPIARMTTAADGNPASITASLGTVNAPVPANNGWVDYGGQFAYTGATGTVDLGFEAISAVGGIAAGNFLDNIQINLRPFVEFAQSAYTQNETSPTGNRPRLLVAGTVPAGGMTVQVTITGGTATLGLDYTTASGTTDVSVFIPAGVYDNTSFPLPITMVNDGSGDPDETITFNITDTAGTGALYNLASLQTCGAAPLANTTSTISEDPDPLPRIQLTKALSANRLTVSDQFVLRITGINGQQTTTTGSGSTVGNGTITVGPATAGSAYTLSEVMAAGSASPLSAYTSSISCTNTTPNSATVLPNGSGTSFTLTVVATDNVSCVITNDVVTAPAFIDVVKTVTSGQLYDSVGDTATYSYVVTNTGPSAVNTLTVTDNRIAAVNCGGVTTLAAAPGPGNSVTCTGSYTVTQADVDDVLVTNIVTASARNPSAQVAIDTDDAVINRAFPAMTADKATTATNYTTVGEVIPYTYVIRNTGNTQIDAIAVADNRIAVVTCPVTTLAVGASTTCTGNYTITQADIDNGSLTNVMTATGTPPAGTLSPITDSVTLVTTRTPAFTLDKTSAVPTYATVGQVVAYSYLVTNTGNVTITALSVTDDKIAMVTCAVTTLAPQANTTCTGSYTITQADLDAGSVTNVATARATPPVGTTLADITDTVTVTATATPALTLVKTAVSGSPYDAVGDVVSYEYAVTNTGNVTISALTVTDDKIASVTCPVTTLAPGASTTCTGSYAIAQADLDAGSVTNNASATGTPATGTLTPTTDSATVTATATPTLTLDKTAVTGNPYDTLGDVVSYEYVVTNTGNVTISALIVTDDKIATVTCPVTTLAPQASTTCSGSYTVTQADLDAGSVTNNAGATGTPASGTLTPATDSATVNATATPTLTLDKTVVSGNPYDTLGDVVSYEYVVANTGNVTITVLTVIDDKIASVTCPVTTLAPQASTTCSGSYTVTQADLDAGSVTNNASASGTPASGTLTPATDSATATSSSTPALTLDKTVVAGAPYAAVGDVVSYEYVVTNPSSVTINAVTVTDDKIATVTCPVATLAPGDSTMCSGSYTITQADLDAGSVTNNAIASGTPASGVLIPGTDSATVNATRTPTLTLDKTVVSGNPYAAVGDVVSYDYAVTNTGNVTISALTVIDDKIATVTCPVTTLAPQASTTCTGSYTITQADLDAGSVTNIATASAEPPAGTVLVPVTDTETVAASATPTLTLDKTAVSGTPYDAVGDVVSYEYVVTNTGNVTISALTVTDDKIATVTCPVTTLAPGESTTCTGTYFTTQADLDAGSVTNNASATGTPASGTLTPTTDSATVNATATPTLTLDKTVVSGNPYAAVSDVVNYEYVVTNTGNVTISALIVTDDKIATVTCPVTTLAPQASTTCTGSYTITQADLDAGSVINNAGATGTPASGTLTPATDSAIVNALASVSYAKTASTAGPVAVGDTIIYTLSVTVAYAATQGVVTLIDTLGPGLDFGGVTATGAFTCNVSGQLVCTLPAGMVPGAYTVTYTATVNGSATGTVNNAVVGSGADSPTCSADCSIEIPVAAPIITVAKSSTPAAGTEVAFGQTIEYALTVTIANSATVSELVLVDTPDSGLTIGTLPSGCVMSGSTITCTLPAGTPAGVYTFVYPATVNAEAGASISNQVTASVSAGDPPVCAACSLTHQIAASELRLAKTVAVRETHIGDLVRYTLTIENVGVGNLVNGSIVDTPAAGFSYVEGSLQVVDGDNAVTVEGQHPLRFSGLDVAAGQTATLTYLMRVGAGVRPGMQQNRAQAQSPNGTPISNVASAEVQLVADPLLDDSLILGTVFDDRDRDGWQDRADLHDVRVQGGFAPDAYIAGSTTVDRGTGAQSEPDASAPLLHGIAVGAISARQSDADPVDDHQVIIRQRLSALTFTDDFVLTSAEGVTVRMDAAGNTTIAKSGEAAKGLNAAMPTVERRIARGEGGYVVAYVIRNVGVDERGTPGVRIASVEGLLIETDQFGRYHLVGMPGGPWEHGRNFILKVDPSTLPAGAEFTTDNPLLRRITPGLPVRFDWGVKLPVQMIEGGTEQVEMTLGDVFFAPGSAEVRSQYLAVIEKIAAKVREYHGGEVVVDANGDTEGLAFDRATAVKQALQSLLDAESIQGLVINARGHVDVPDSLIVGVDEGGTVLGTVLFDTDQSSIRPEFAPLLDRIAVALERKGGGAIAIVGHTDVRGSYAYNTALGMRRAKAVYEAVAKRLAPEVRAKVRVEVRDDPATPVGAKRNEQEQGS